MRPWMCVLNYCLISEVVNNICSLFTCILLSFAAFCDKTFYGSSGTITSPDYYSIKSSYANNQNCQFDIKVSSGSAVKLTWTTFDVKGDMPNCNDDYVEIYIGCSRKSIGKYCSDNSYKPHDIYSPDNCLRIKFKSDSSGSGKGFLASYSTFYTFSLGMYMYLLHNYM